MTIQSDWNCYCNNVLVDFGDLELTEIHLGLLRHAFFCGASVTYADAMSAAKRGTGAETMMAIRDELERFMAERSDGSISVH